MKREPDSRTENLPLLKSMALPSARRHLMLGFGLPVAAHLSVALLRMSIPLLSGSRVICGVATAIINAQ